MNPDDPIWGLPPWLRAHALSPELLARISGRPMQQPADASGVARPYMPQSTMSPNTAAFSNPIEDQPIPGVHYLYGDMRDILNPQDPESGVMDLLPGISGVRAATAGQKLYKEGHKGLGVLLGAAGAADLGLTGYGIKAATKPAINEAVEGAVNYARRPAMAPAVEPITPVNPMTGEPFTVNGREVGSRSLSHQARLDAGITEPLPPGGHMPPQPVTASAEPTGINRLPVVTEAAAPLPPAPKLPKGAVITDKTHDLLRELGYEHSPSAVPTPGGEAPSVGGRQTLHESLPREEAVAKNREYAQAGVPTEMKKNPDGTFRIEQKGAGAAKPRAAEKKEAEDQLLGDTLTPEERDDYETLPGKLTKHMSEGLERARAEAPEGSTYNEKIWNEVREGAESMRQRYTSLRDRVETARTLKEAESGELVGLTPGELKTLQEYRRGQNEIRDAISRYEVEIQGTTRDNPGLVDAYEHAKKVLADRQKSIDILQGREHLPPAEAKALVPVKQSTAVTRQGIAGQGKANEAGFQSRLLTAFDTSHQGKAMSYDDWMKALEADPNVPKSELKHVFDDAARKHLESFEDSNPDGLIDAEHVQDYIEKHAPAQKLESKTLVRNRKDTLTAEQQAEQDAADAADAADDEPRDLTDDEQEEMHDEMYQRAAERVDEQRQHRREELIDSEMEHYREMEAEYIRSDRIPEALQERDDLIEEIRSQAAKVFGDDGAEKFMKELETAPISAPESDTEWEGPWLSADDLESMGSRGLSDWKDDIYIPEQVGGLIDRLKVDPHQLRLGEDIPRNLGHERHTTADGTVTERDITHGTIADEIRPEFTPEEIDNFHNLLRDAAEKQDDAIDLAKAVDEGDYDEQMIRQQAEESVDENFDEFIGEDRDQAIQDEMDNMDTAEFDPRENAGREARRRQLERDRKRMNPWVSNTEYHDSQRVDREKPYREVLVHESQGNLAAGHFTTSHNLAAHARGEVHGDTYLMIEAQSDASAKTGQRKNSPFMKVERWTQLSTGGSLRQAASEGLDHFAWVNGANRHRIASLNDKAAKLFYDKEIPEAVKRIFRELDLPMEVETWTPAGLDPKDEANVFQRVKLTPEIREKILKAGIPALGLVGAAITTRKKAGNAKATD